MTAEFSDEQVGKRVIDRRGNVIGTVSEVRDGELYVELGPDADRETLDDLGWGRIVNQEVHHLEARFVTDTTDETVRLRV
ncbi:hypothetical protein [Halegenticoccus soli]|uniref:hypothetical protein n=1 Tax=Halegenticoccus soli TaxID=1985678 RepID=UPI000C6CC502|nr:hypothetical protein [Halegenticoccus soli]